MFHESCLANPNAENIFLHNLKVIQKIMLLFPSIYNLSVYNHARHGICFRPKRLDKKSQRNQTMITLQR